jgi:capsular polysaccharide transport system permease protein
VKLGYDPTEGVIRMEVASADPDRQPDFSEKLIEYAEERVDELSAEKRQDASRPRSKASRPPRRAPRRTGRLVSLQEGSILDPEGEIGIRAADQQCRIAASGKAAGAQHAAQQRAPQQARVDRDSLRRRSRARTPSSTSRTPA